VSFFPRISGQFWGQIKRNIEQNLRLNPRNVYHKFLRFSARFLLILLDLITDCTRFTHVSLSVGAVFSAFLAGYLANLWGYNLPPPKPKAVGIDLGTTFSSIGIHQSVTDRTQIVADSLGKRSVPSVVGFL
jgi:hypothetical protein